MKFRINLIIVPICLLLAITLSAHTAVHTVKARETSSSVSTEAEEYYNLWDKHKYSDNKNSRKYAGQCLIIAAEQNHPEALYDYYSKLYYGGKEYKIKKNERKGLEMLKKSAYAGSIRGKYDMYCHYNSLTSGRKYPDIFPDRAQLKAWLLEAVEAGHQEAINSVSMDYLNGYNDFPKDESKAIRFLTESVKGPRKNEFSSSDYYYESNAKELVELLNKNKDGQKAKELAYILDRKGEAEIAKEFHLCAANSGVVSEMVYLGDSYQKGQNGFHKDSRQALKWYEEAAKNGSKGQQAKISQLKKEISSPGTGNNTRTTKNKLSKSSAVSSAPASRHSASHNKSTSASTSSKLEDLGQALQEFGNSLIDASSRMSGNQSLSYRNGSRNSSTPERNIKRTIPPSIDEKGVKTWREPYNTYGWTNYRQLPDGSVGVFNYDVCHLCHGTKICESCNGTGICASCHGLRYTRVTRYSRPRPCMLCSQTGRCPTCHGKRICSCASSEHPGFNIVSHYMFDARGNLTGSSSAYRNYESSGSNSSSQTYLVTCSHCNGTGLSEPLRSATCKAFPDQCYDIDCKACKRRHCRHLNQHKNCVFCNGTGKTEKNNSGRYTHSNSGVGQKTCRMCNGTGLSEPLRGAVCKAFPDQCYDIDCKACKRRHCHHLNHHKSCVFCGGTGKE